MNLDGIKTYLPYFQFAAVVMTIALGSHKALEYVQAASPAEQLVALIEKAKCGETVVVPGTDLADKRECPKPITLEKVVVEDGRTGGTAAVSTWFTRNRPDCPFVTWKPEIIAADGFQYGTSTSLGAALTPPPAEGDLHTDKYLISLKDIPPGPATYRASIDYSCPDSVGLEVVFYPPNLTFCVLNPDGSRPELCGAPGER